MVVRSNGKLKNSFHFKTYRSTAGYDLNTESYQLFGNWIQGIGINYTPLSDITTKPDAKHLTTGEASSTLSRKGNNCHISIVGINSNVPQVAPRTTREYPASTAISYTFFFPV